MDRDRRRKLEDLFRQVHELPEDRREELLHRHRGDDPGLVSEVRSLLMHAAIDDSFLEKPEYPKNRRPAAHPGAIGDYRIVRLLGSGGMGEVYLAEQSEPIRRKVALKLIKRGVDTEQVLRRFDAERQALALMDHPTIARVYDAGASQEGRPFFVMEYVDGVPAAEFCDRNRLDLTDRLRLFIQICEGVQHAHQRGVIHRDIKSSNVLVTTRDGEAVPKIIDFGIAKATDDPLGADTALTEAGQFMGTPEYMSPEQSELTHRDLDTRTDVYSLGVLLYRLLVGRYPFNPEDLRRATLDELRRMIREDDPAVPSTRFQSLGEATTEVSGHRRADPATLLKSLRGDLDWICMKALEKDRARRYASAADLAADVQRYLSDEPVHARPPTRTYRLQKFVRRNRVGVTAASVIFLGLALGVLGIVVGLVRAVEAEHRARAEAAAKRSVLHFINNVFQEWDPESGPKAGTTVAEILEAGTRQVDSLSDQPLEQAELMTIIGEIQMRNDNHDVARPLLERALAIKREFYGDEHPDVLDVVNALGILSAMTRDDQQARMYFQQALKTGERILDADDEDLAAIMKNLGDTLTRLGELDQARRLHERSLAIRRRADPESARVARSMRSVADLYRKAGDYDTAIPMLEESLRIRLKTEPPGHYRVGYGHIFLGQALREAGRAEEARPHCERALEIWEAVFESEPDHQLLRDASFELALTLTELGELRGVEPLFERALAIDEQQFGADHPYVAETLESYASFLRTAGRADEAAVLDARAAAIAQAQPEGG